MIGFLKDEESVEKDPITYGVKFLIYNFFSPLIFICSTFFLDREYTNVIQVLAIAIFSPFMLLRLIFLRKPMGFRHVFVFLLYPLWAWWFSEETVLGKQYEFEILISVLIMFAYFPLCGVYKLIKGIPAAIESNAKEARLKQFLKDQDKKVTDYMIKNHPEVMEMVEEEHVAGYVEKNHPKLYEQITGRNKLIRVK